MDKKVKKDLPINKDAKPSKDLGSYRDLKSCLQNSKGLKIFP